MKSRIALLGAVALVSLFASKTAIAQVGAPFIHDPSTIMECDGKYYTFGTGGGGLISEDGWNWHSGAVRPGGGAAPDAVKIGDRYLVGYSATGGGLGGGHAGRILTMWNKTLDPESPDFEYSEAVEVAASLVDEDCDAIDIGFLLDPSTGRLFCTYGTYFGFIRQVELDPKTGHRLAGNEAIDVAIDCEASVMMYNNGWYYLLGTHGTCCDGVNATYNIICGRSRNPNGPFIDNVGRTMIEGGGKMVAAAEERRFGAGHFGRYVVDEGVEKASFHWEADLDLSGRSTLAIRPLLWKNDWPEVGELVAEGTYEIESVRRGYALELAVDFVRAAGGMRGFGRGGDQPNVVIENQKLEEVCEGWPEKTEIRISDYMSLRPAATLAALTSRLSSRAPTGLLQLPLTASSRAPLSTAPTPSSGVSTSSSTAPTASCPRLSPDAASLSASSPSPTAPRPLRSTTSTATTASGTSSTSTH